MVVFETQTAVVLCTVYVLLEYSDRNEAVIVTTAWNFFSSTPFEHIWFTGN